MGTSLSMKIGAFHDALTASKRRLAVPGLPAIERGDAFQLMAAAYICLGEFDSCITTIEEALWHIRPGEPLLHLGSGVSHAISAAFVTGRWDKIDALMPKLEEMREQAQYDPSTFIFVINGYYDIVEVALARENYAVVEAATSALMRIFPDSTCRDRIFLTTILTDDAQKLDFELLERISAARSRVGIRLLIFYSEHGKPLPAAFITQVAFFDYWKSKQSILYGEIAQALVDDDNIQLAKAIEAAEAYRLIVHAARMRIILAQRTGDRLQLERARPVLQHLQDRRSLRKLEEVEAMIGG